MNRERLEAPIDPVRRLPERATPGDALGCEGYVPTRTRFGKGCGTSFPVFMTIRFLNQFGLDLWGARDGLRI